MGLSILGTGSYTPEHKLTNEDFTEFIETNDEWIRTRTGIRSRRVADGEPTWYMGAQAARAAIEAAGIDPTEIGLIIDTTITQDFCTPSTSCIIQRETGAVNAACFDLNAACSGFVYALDMAHRFLKTEPSARYALVLANEQLSRITNYEDRSSCILFGDGAAAAVVEYKADALYSSHLGADGTGAKFLFARTALPASPFIDAEKAAQKWDDFDEGIIGRYAHCMKQDGKEVYRFATQAMPKAAAAAAEKIGFDLQELDRIVPHQANIRIIETAMKNMKLPMEKAVVNIAEHGNTSSASIPIALDEAVRSGQIKRGDKICLVGFGAGLTYAAVIMEY
ncbi:MAG: ketoacyl-ACP synthase III [Ruminococcus sp.]|nr:ketoacyl-ACP synthase III [Ruminococcus sp.]